MTTATSASDAVHDLVGELLDGYDDNRTNAPLLDRVAELLEPGRTGPSDRTGPRGKAAAPPLPVAGGPWAWLGDLDAEVRLLERLVRRETGLPVRERGASRANTTAALRGLPALVAALPSGHPLRGEVVVTLARLHGRAGDLTGHRQAWTRVPEPCPVCGCASLRQRPEDGAVVCLRPTCVDGTGARTAWSLHELGWLGRVVAG